MTLAEYDDLIGWHRWRLACLEQAREALRERTRRETDPAYLGTAPRAVAGEQGEKNACTGRGERARLSPCKAGRRVAPVALHRSP